MAHLTAGARLGELTIIRRLGSGSLSDVYEAQDAARAQRIAVKVLAEVLQRDRDFLARFEGEIRACASLSHAHIVKVYGRGFAQGVSFFTMELMGGGDLRQRIGTGMPEQDVRTVLSAVLLALEHAHTRGFIHRDLRPENVLFDDTGRAALSDFGIAKMLGAQADVTQIGAPREALLYASPEQASGQDVDGRTDLYSLGCVLYELLTGMPPFSADTPIGTVFLHMTAPVPRLSARYAHWQPFLERLMAKKPEDRFATAAAALQALEKILPTWNAAGIEPNQQNAPGAVRTAELLHASEPPVPSPTPVERAASAYAATGNLDPQAEDEPGNTKNPVRLGGLRRAGVALGFGLLVAGVASMAMNLLTGSRAGMAVAPEPVVTPAPRTKPTSIPTATAAPTATPAPTPTISLTPTTAPTSTPTPTANPTNTPAPTATPTAVPSPTATATPRITATPQPTIRVTKAPSPPPSPRKSTKVTPAAQTAEALARQRQREVEDAMRLKAGDAQRAALESRFQRLWDQRAETRALEDELRGEERAAQIAAGADPKASQQQFVAEDQEIAETRRQEDVLLREEAESERRALESKLKRIESWVRRKRLEEDAAENVDINR